MKIKGIFFCLCISNFLFSAEFNHRLQEITFFDGSFNPLSCSNNRRDSLSFSTRLDSSKVENLRDLLSRLQSQEAVSIERVLQEDANGVVSYHIKNENEIDVFAISSVQSVPEIQQEAFLDKFSLANSLRRQSKGNVSISRRSNPTTNFDDEKIFSSSSSSTFSLEDDHKPWYVLVKDATDLGDVATLRSLIKKDHAYQDLCLFLKEGAKIQRKDPLHLVCSAAQKGNMEVMRSLLIMGFDKSAKDFNGKTPLHHAIEKEDLDMIEELLGNNLGFITPVDIGYKYFSNGDSYLHVAARQGNLEIIKMLIEYGVDIHKLNCMEKKAADVAYDEGHYHLVELLGGTTSGFCGNCSCVAQ